MSMIGLMVAAMLTTWGEKVTNTPGRPEKWDGKILVPFALLKMEGK